ncbi:Isoleucine--tRNA ligase [Dissostichus eleginoides]|uniref:Isoleucine--tRNA ligase n=1 Tax=Dissostichus eleginoides TaxID=100907 RepID=A0AAD9BJK6_DISEL|nr:Isoleucine--tRNA ligase [Dissostichus eleginoides]
MRLNGSQEEEGRDLSGVRIEQPDKKYFQGVSVSSGVEVEPNHTFTLLLKSPNQHCNQSKDLHVYDIATNSLSLLWLSHDTGAVAMTAQMSLLTHYQTSYRPTFRITSVSDPYMVILTHDNRGVRFTESGVVKFVLQQALYSMGHTCIREGFSLIAYTNHNGTGQEAMQAFKTGVNYRDTSITLSGAVSVAGGDTLSFEITSVFGLDRYRVQDRSALRSVRNKQLSFQQISPDTPQVHLSRQGEPNSRKNFVFHEKGTVNIALNLKLIHSCNIVKLTMQKALGPGGTSAPVAQQVSGSMPEGSEWASIGLRASFPVQNGTAVYVTLDCIRGRVNQITHEGGTNISILWVAV